MANQQDTGRKPEGREIEEEKQERDQKDKVSPQRDLDGKEQANSIISGEQADERESPPPLPLAPLMEQSHTQQHYCDTSIVPLLSHILTPTLPPTFPAPTS